MKQFQLDLFENSEIFYVTSQAIQREFSAGMSLINHMKANEYKIIWILQGPPDEHIIRVFGFTDKAADRWGNSWNWQSEPAIPSRFHKHITWFS